MKNENRGYNCSMNPPQAPTQFAIAYKESAAGEGEKVADYLKQNGIHSMYSGKLNHPDLEQVISSGKVDVLIALGGDGTMLNASNLCAQAGVSILGINMGSIGFLMELQRTDWRDYMPRLLKGDYRREERMLLRACHYRAEKQLGEWEVVNEVVVCRGQMVKPIRLHASVNGYPMASYVADGLIAATPTGSTAYALAAGGAILPPELRNILIVAVAPHLSMDRAIILAEGSSVTITVNTTHQAVLSADGHAPVTLEDNDQVRVEASQRNVTFIRFHDPGYFYRNLNRYMEQNPSSGAK